MTIGPGIKAIFKFRRVMMIVAPWCILAGYWIVLFILTHLPSKHIPRVDVLGKDQTLHYLAYLGLALVFWLCYYRNVKPSFRQKRTWLMIFTLICYGIFDEITQKYFGRTTDIMDLVFDMFGILSAVIMLFFIRKLIQWLFVIMAVLFVFSHWPGQREFVELPENMRFFYPLAYMSGYSLTTLLWWRCLSPKNRFMVNRYIFAWTSVIMLAYCFFDQFVLILMRKGFDSEKLTIALMSITIGIVVSVLLGLENQVEDNYQKHRKHLDEYSTNDPLGLGDEYL